VTADVELASIARLTSDALLRDCSFEVWGRGRLGSEERPLLRPLMESDVESGVASGLPPDTLLGDDACIRSGEQPDGLRVDRLHPLTATRVKISSATRLTLDALLIHRRRIGNRRRSRLQPPVLR